MAKARANKMMGSLELELPECPVCFLVLSAPIYNCSTGHSLCGSCTDKLCPAICPQCRQPMTRMRNRSLEDHIAKQQAKAKVCCPNQAKGCVYTMTNQEIGDHLNECIFRETECPHGAIFGKCSWNGEIKNMLEHFIERHPENCNANTDTDIELDNVSVTVDDRHLYLVAQGKMIFILTMKIDTIQKMAYWIVQHIGSKKIAQQHVYEIHITSKQDSRRKAMFFEYCFNDAIKSDEIFRQGKCAIMPLSMLSHFIKDKKLVFKFLIKRLGPNPNQKFEKVQGNRCPSEGPSGSGPRGPGPQRGSWRPGPPRRGRQPRDPRPESPSVSYNSQRSPSPFISSGPKGQFRNTHPFNFQD